MNQKQFSSVLNQGKRHESCQTWQRKVCDHFCETFIFLKYGVELFEGVHDDSYQ